MPAEIQLSLFGPNDTVSLLIQEIQQLKEQTANVRRGLFARHNELAKLVLKQQQEIDELKNIKHGGEVQPEIMEMVLL